MLRARLVPAADALARAGIEPIELTAKEGLALINGTDGMLGMLVLALSDLSALLRVAEVAAAMSVEALLGTDRVFAEDLIALRPQPGQVASASNLRALLAGSAIVASHRFGDPRVQDAYSLRCAPQVVGAARDAVGVRLAVSLTWSFDPRSTTRWSWRTGGSSRAATSTGRRWGWRAIAGDRGGAGGRDRRAADRPAARCLAVARAAAVPGC